MNEMHIIVKIIPRYCKNTIAILCIYVNLVSSTMEVRVSKPYHYNQGISYVAYAALLEIAPLLEGI